MPISSLLPAPHLAPSLLCPPTELAHSFPPLQLREIMDAKIEAQEPWFGFEQEYTMLAKGTGRVYGWPASGFPTPQVSFRPASSDGA